MYLAELGIKNFRKLRDAKLEFQPGLNVLVGPNNVGKAQWSMRSVRFSLDMKSHTHDSISPIATGPMKVSQGRHQLPFRFQRSQP